MSETLTQQVARFVSSYFRYDSPKPYQIDASDSSVIYQRWSTDDLNPIFIARISTVGNVTKNDYGFDLWSNRATATYNYNVE